MNSEIFQEELYKERSYMGLFNWGQKSSCSECSKIEEAQRKMRESINFSKTLVEQIQELETAKMNATNEKIKSLEARLEEEVKKNAMLIVENDKLIEENKKLLTTVQEVRYTNAGLQADIEKLDEIRNLQKSAEEIKSIIEKNSKLEEDLEQEIRKNARLIVEMENNKDQMDKNNIDKEIALKMAEDKNKMNELLEEKIKDVESVNAKLAEETAKRLTLQVDVAQRDEQITYLNTIIQKLTRSNPKARQFELKPGLFVSTR